ncbi:MAG: molybdopterin-dependent oxidoreductase [Bryobacteraceae bacterium]|nr:molybdopterin-dependent oxidoreductase [Bryobacteraceae bacterium]
MKTNLLAEPGAGTATEVTRRDLLALAGSGLFVLFSTKEAHAQTEKAPDRPTFPTDFNAYLRIAPDGKVTGLAGKIEMGQGSRTVLSQLIADELDVEYDSVEMIMVDTDVSPWDMGTWGSLNVRQYSLLVRAAAAEARAVLLQMASEKLGVPVSRLVVHAGVISDQTAPDKRVSYGQLVDGKKITRHLPKVPIKPYSELHLSKRHLLRKDALAKVTGKAEFTADVKLPGMLYARVVRPPAHGAKLKSANTEAAEKAGARVIRDGDLIAVLHERPDVADHAIGLVKAEFDTPQSDVDEKSIFAYLEKIAPPPKMVKESGNIAEGEKQAASIVEQTYMNAYGAHAPIETHSALASFENGKVTVWASTQTPFPLRDQLVDALKLPQASVRVIVPYVGGGFGGKAASGQAIEAARLSRLVGKPVQVVYDRAEEFFYDYVRPAAVIKLRTGLTSDGKISSWDCKLIAGGEREAIPFYAFANQRTVTANRSLNGNPNGMHFFGTGAWRAPSVNSNTFARESQMDVLAAKAGVDPVEFRLRHLADARMKHVLETAAQRFGWKPGKAPSGRGQGVALGMDVGTYCATFAEVSVDKATGAVKVHRMVVAMDPGVAVNPDGVLQQMEGATTMGLGYALSEELRFQGGKILNHNFDTYQLPLFSWLPKIECIIVEVPGAPAQGCAEPPVVTVGAVLANAIFDLTGARLFQLPMTPERVKQAIARV